MTASAAMTSAICPICGTSAAEDRSLGPLGFARCPGCSFVFRPDAEELAQVYSAGDYGHREIYHGDIHTKEWSRNSRARLKYVLRHCKSGRLFDVGAGGGQFVVTADNAGFDAWGVEPSASFAQHARDHHHADVIDGHIEDLQLDPDSQDVITMWHVLEHIADPVSVLELLRPALKPDGVLVVEVPNTESVSAKQLGHGWPALDPEVHVCQFTGDTLALALSTAGYEIKELLSVTHASYLGRLGWLAPRSLVHEARVLAVGWGDPMRNDFLRVAATAAR